MSSKSYPHPASEAVSRVMRANRKVDTKPEQRVRSLLHRSGYRFRKNHPIQAGEVRVRPDIVFPRSRLAVFIDGCFWHCCPAHGNAPRRNSAYWAPKLERNVARDRKVDHALQEAGWQVLRYWEHVPPEEAAALIASQLTRFGAQRSPRTA